MVKWESRWLCHLLYDFHSKFRHFIILIIGIDPLIAACQYYRERVDDFPSSFWFPELFGRLFLPLRCLCSQILPGFSFPVFAPARESRARGWRGSEHGGSCTLCSHVAQSDLSSSPPWLFLPHFSSTSDWPSFQKTKSLSPLAGCYSMSHLEHEGPNETTSTTWRVAQYDWSFDFLVSCFRPSRTFEMDYFDSLSPDIPSRIFSFTTTPTISRCCRISRNSLQIIQSNPNLHQEVDLFKLDRKQDLPLILFILSKYSYLSRNTMKHVFIHTAFMKQESSPQEPVIRDAFEIFDSRTSSSSSLDHNPSLLEYSFEGISMIVQAPHPSRATLQYLSFQIPNSHQFNVQRINHLIPYLDQHLPNLKGLFFYVPDALEDIQCGSDSSRMVVIKNNFSSSKTWMTQYNEADLIKLLQHMRSFCRGQAWTRFCGWKKLSNRSFDH